MMSSRIRSGGFADASSSALAPLVAALTLYCSPSSPASSEMLVGVSSTARIVAASSRVMLCRLFGGERGERRVELEVFDGPPHPRVSLRWQRVLQLRAA